MHDETAGGLLLILAGVMNGSFALPMKRMPAWQWENIWLVWTVLALLLLPFLLASLFVPHYWMGLGEIPVSSLLPVVAYGAAWGVAQVLFGLSVSGIGVALTFSLVLGISAALGAVVPFLQMHAELLWTPTGAFLFVGIAVLAAGMVLCARAGILRERAGGSILGSIPMRLGLLLAILSGILASSMNVGFSHGTSLSAMAVQHGASKTGMAAAIWFPLLAGGAVPNLIYTAYLLKTHKTITLYRAPKLGSYVLLTACMAILWFASTVLYGVASGLLGSLGVVLGWPIFMSIVVVVASAIGWMAGEWSGSGKRPFRLQMAGLTLLIAAVFLFSRAVG
jgi:L-rhamnose-H+ transport protein